MFNTATLIAWTKVKFFTYDEDKFAGLPEYVNELHNEGMKYIPILVSFKANLSHDINGSQLAKMNNSIPDMSLPLKFMGMKQLV